MNCPVISYFRIKPLICKVFLWATILQNFLAVEPVSTIQYADTLLGKMILLLKHCVIYQSFSHFSKLTFKLERS